MNDALINRILRAPTGLKSRLRIGWLRLLGASIGPACRVVSPEIPQNPWDIRLDQGVALDRHVTLLAIGERTDSPRITIGANCYINRRTMIDASLSVEIGAHCMIGPECYITDHDHGTALGQPVGQQPLIEAPVRIGEDVWLGAQVKILKGVTIGAGSIIGSGSTVTRDIPENVIAVGSPARVVRDRT
ncbi:acyltransferase [uncultured Pelagimonas sp.]|uniref:acyltransferase n=1 Tax=uncultured Pelagimonas sp. TaxID=1618102 RepID=UPI002626C4A9|nr:acyltransferase [uncultured Pelagimonas sp.]